MFAGMARFPRFCISSSLMGFANRELGVGSRLHVAQEREGKIQVAQECEESAGKRWQGLVPETAADQSPMQSVSSLGCSTSKPGMLIRSQVSYSIELSSRK